MALPLLQTGCLPEAAEFGLAGEQPVGEGALLAELSSWQPRPSREAEAQQTGGTRQAPERESERESSPAGDLKELLAQGEKGSLAERRQRQRPSRMPVVGLCVCVCLCADTSVLGLVQRIKFQMLVFLMDLGQCKPSLREEDASGSARSLGRRAEDPPPLSLTVPVGCDSQVPAAKARGTLAERLACPVEAEGSHWLLERTFSPEGAFLGTLLSSPPKETEGRLQELGEQRGASSACKPAQENPPPDTGQAPLLGGKEGGDGQWAASSL